MAKNKGPSLPATPSYYTNPNLLPNIDWFSQEGRGLTSGDFTGSRSWLADLVSYNPQSTQLALQSAQGFLQPQFNDTLTQIRNEAAANNQLESSTFTNALAKSAEDLQSQYQGIAANAALNDLYQANSNKLGLYEFGANLMGQGTQFAQGESNSKNEFNMKNYENQVAAALYGKKDTGGLFGGLTGGVGGAILGGLLAAPTGGMSVAMGSLLGGLGGGTLGAFSPSGTGGQLLNAGASMFGSNIGGSTGNLSFNRSLGKSYLPGMMSTSDLLKQYGGLSPYTVPTFGGF